VNSAENRANDERQNCSGKIFRQNICLEIKNALLKLPNGWSLDGFEFESVYE
jgi:hypothetical protein